MANKVRSKGKVLDVIGKFSIRQIKDSRKDARTANSTTICIMRGKKIIQTGFKNAVEAKEVVIKLL